MARRNVALFKRLVEMRRDILAKGRLVRGESSDGRMLCNAIGG
jgi:hypothetical protein